MRYLVSILLAVSTVSSFAGSVDLTGDWNCKFHGVHEESLEKANGSLKDAMIKGENLKVKLEHQDNIVTGAWLDPLEISDAAKDSANQKAYTKNKMVLCSMTDTGKDSPHMDCVSTQARNHICADAVSKDHLKGSLTRHADKTGSAREVASAISFECRR